MSRPLTEIDWVQYGIAEKLNEIETDPDDRPFKSKYEARQLWTFLRTKLLSFVEDPEKEKDDSSIFESALATLSYELARNYAATEERSTGEIWAKEALERIETKNRIDDNREKEKEFISVKIALRNTLGCIYCERADSDSAVACLKEAERLYIDYTKSKSENNRSAAPWELTRSIRWVCGVLDDVDDRVSINEDEWKTFEQLHTYTLYYLAQTYKQIGELASAAKYCQETLVRQLKADSYDPLEWSINTATLAVYYIDKSSRKAFFRARRCLAAADAVLAKTKDDRGSEKRSRSSADVDRCWAKYGLALLEESRQLLLGESREIKDESDADEIAPEDDFPTYLPDLVGHEQEIRSDFVQNFAEARDVFLKIQRRVTNAQTSFYTLNDHATDYTELVQDSSRAYKALAFYESDIDRKCKMHKRRIDSLVAVYKELNPTYYLAVRRQISFELGEIYNDMLDLKIEITDEKNEGVPSAHQIAKINMLAKSGIQYFREFLHSFEKQEEKSDGGGDQSSTTKYDSADVRPIVLAHFYCGRLFSKILTGDMREKLVNCDACLREYRWVVDYVDRVDPESLDRVKSEYEVCKDMVSLLPLKMDRMKSAIT